MKRFFLCLILVLLFTPPAFAASGGGDFTADELKLMSEFLSNVTEIGFLNFDVETLLKSDKVIDFGILANYSDFDNRIKTCGDGSCPYGSAFIDPSHVAESIKKYFGVDFKDHRSVKPDHEFFMEYLYYYDGKLYHFESGYLWSHSYARVDGAVQNSSGQVVMTGELIDCDDEDVVRGKFEAVMKPYNYGGKNTWAIISMKSEVFEIDEDDE